MAVKNSNIGKFIGHSIAILSITGLVLASLVIITRQNLPTRALTFVRSLAEGNDVLASEKSESDIDSKIDDDDIRLPGDVLPKAYDLSIAVNLSTLTFSGHVQITVLCAHSTERIILHAKDLNVRRTNISSLKTRKDLKIQKISAKPEYDHYIIELDQALKKHRHYVIKMKYEANISKTLDGFHKSYYTTGMGEKRPLVVTHFAPMSARKAFPCFDEPAMKANFTLHISRDPTHQSLSNMARDHEESQAIDLVVDHYVTSPPMSTYLVSFMVLDFDFQETRTTSGVRIRVFAPPKDTNNLKFALNIASKTLTFYEKLFGVAFPFKKLDLVAVPDFELKAMEDWGLLSFRRELLVYDENVVTASAKQQTMRTITHELAHMWFGDLVTIKWWNDVWLSEGFATFFSYLACYNIDKETDSLAVSVLERWENALRNDGQTSSHPLINSATTPEETEKIFDAISYDKGAMVLKMMMNTLGNSAFLKGVRLYIDKSKYGNVETADLWKFLSKVGKRLDLTRLMKSWTDQKSFPIVTLKRLKGPEKDIILAKQESFLEHKLTNQHHVTDANIYEDTTADQIDHIEKQRQFSSRPWHIPLTYMVQSTAFKEYTVWLDKKWEKLSVLDPQGWIKANVRSNGFYIVNYDKANWIKIIKQLKNYHVVFSPSDRAGLIHDAFVLACEGMLDASIPLKLVMYMAKEEHYVPMEMLRKKSKCLESLFEDKEVKELYKEYLWYLQEHLLEKLGMEDKGGILEQLNRHSIISYAVPHRPDIKRKFVHIFQQLRQSKDQRVLLKGLSSNFRELAFIHGVNKSDSKDWEYLWKVYETSPYDSDRRFLRPIIGSFERDDLFSKNLQRIITSGKVRSQDSLEWLSKMSLEKFNEQMWTFLKQNWKRITERFGKNYKLAELLNKVAKKLKTTTHFNEVKQFLSFDAKGLMGEKLYRQTLDSIEKNLNKPKAKKHIEMKKAIKWLRHYMKKIRKRGH